ncbi:MAG: patatin-like phospholipase family protein, partial [Prevotellaceae bacterium]|nr:patatin-like phospholipase family protein [Prevotellaceae bacterium]
MYFFVRFLLAGRSRRWKLLFLLLLSAPLSGEAKEGIGVALSGGAARGFAHLGALQALEDHGIIPTHVSGASMGA